MSFQDPGKGGMGRAHCAGSTPKVAVRLHERVLYENTGRLDVNGVQVVRKRIERNCHQVFSTGMGLKQIPG